jgi:enterochelin esterase-like enzyme
MIECLTYSSQAIKNFPMGDPHERALSVYLPPGYDQKRSDPYPVVFILAGYGSRSASYLSDNSIFTPSLATFFDKAMQSEKQKAIVVFPDGTSRLGCSQYINSPTLGHYQDHIADELVQFIDNRYHTHRSAQFRGIAGHSSGGFGALVMGMQRPDVFQYICSSAGDTFFPALFIPLINTAVNEIAAAGGIAEFLKFFLESPNPGALGSKKFETIMPLGMAPCFAPNLQNAPLYGDCYFDLKTGRLIDEVWQRYLAWDPINLMEHYIDNLKKLRWIHLDAGLTDEYSLQLGHRQFAEKLTHHKIPFYLNEYPGGHSGHHWRFADRLELMLQKMFA